MISRESAEGREVAVGERQVKKPRSRLRGGQLARRALLRRGAKRAEAEAGETTEACFLALVRGCEGSF